jgi:hypothetical protein
VVGVREGVSAHTGTQVKRDCIHCRDILLPELYIPGKYVETKYRIPVDWQLGTAKWEAACKRQGDVKECP